uniref:Uncharacterized protein n=1 Tax=Magallana gigas TaxID=29159 RepID=K1R922_MAGGI
MSKYKGKDFDDIEFSQTATSGQYTSEHEHFDGNDEEHDYDMENIKRKKKTVPHSSEQEKNIPHPGKKGIGVSNAYMQNS